MKVFIIRTHYRKSIEYAGKCLNSFENYKGWEPEYFEGLTPDTIEKYSHIKHKKRSRAEDFFKKNIKKYWIKKSCSLNHYRLFRICVKLNEPVSIIEHDSHCINDWKDVKFEHVLILNAMAALNQSCLSHAITPADIPQNGMCDINIEKIRYRHDQEINGNYIMPGTAAYAITPIAAQKMINVYETIGWEQSDHIINTAYVRIQTLIPELFVFKLPNLRMSHGENLL